MLRQIWKQRAEKDHKRILQKNKPFYDSLIQKNYKESDKKINRKSKLGLLFGPIAAVLAAAVTLTVLYWPAQNNCPVNENQTENQGENHNGHQDEKQYYEENLKSRETDLSELTEDVADVVFNIETYYSLSIKVYYDEPTNDKLYYEITASDEYSFETWKIDIQVNSGCILPVTITALEMTTAIYGFTVNYYYNFTQEDDIYFSDGKALMDTDIEKIYFEFEIASFDEPSGFEEQLSRIISVKQ